MRPMRSTQTPTPSVQADTSVVWSASLVQPRKASRGSTQPVVVDVTAPVVLDGAVSLQVGGQATSAVWLGESSQARRCQADVAFTGGPADLRVYVVVGRVRSYAGVVSVTAR